MAILAGQIGAETKIALFSHVFDSQQNKIIIDGLIKSKSFETKEYECEGEKGTKTLNTKKMIEELLEEADKNKKSNSGEKLEQPILGACFGIAGPVGGDKDNKQAKISRPALDLNVTFYESDFQKQLPCPDVPIAFINDMVGIGKNIFLPQYEPQWTVLYDKEGQIQPEPKDRKAIMLVSGGLGQALWYSHKGKEALEPISSEGGHGLWAPRNEEEAELFLHLLKNRPPVDGRNQPISHEYVLSGPGFIMVYEYLKMKGHYGEESEDLRQQLTKNNTDPKPIIEKAVNASDSLSIESLKWFTRLVGARAGDVALTYQAEGGVYIGGLPTFFKKLEKDDTLKNTFLEAFRDKEGNFRQYNEEIPVYIYEEEDSVLLGAARHAVDLGFVTKGVFAYKRMNRPTNILSPHQTGYLQIRS